MIKKLSEIKAESGRDLDSLTDNDLLIPAESSAGTFGVIRFFQGIKNFFKGVGALGSLSATGRIPTHDANGNVSYVTPQQILDCVSTINGDKNFANNVSVAGALNVMGVNLDVKINGALQDFITNYIQEYTVPNNSSVKTYISATSNENQKFGFLVLETTHSSSGNATATVLYLLKVGYDGNYVNVTKISEINTAGSVGTTDFSVTDGYIWITNNHQVNKRFLIFGRF